jgi:hypothetical protein
MIAAEREAVLYRAFRLRAAVSEGRDWLLDCFPEHEREIRLLNAVGVFNAIENQYEGGWLAFLADCENLRPDTSGDES